MMNKKEIVKIFEENYLKVIGHTLSFNGSLKELYIMDRNLNTFTFYVENNIPLFKGKIKEYDKLFIVNNQYINLFNYFTAPHSIAKYLPTFSKYYRKDNSFYKTLEKRKNKKLYKI